MPINHFRLEKHGQFFVSATVEQLKNQSRYINSRSNFYDSILKMKLYQISQDDFRFLGFAPNQIDQKYFFNRNNLMTFVVCFFCCASTLLFIIYEAKTFVDYVEAIYIFSAGLGSTVALATLRVKTMSKYIAALEKMIISSECTDLQF